jgi:hypothetical protein
MDASSGAVSAIAVTQIADSILSLCHDYLTNVQDAPKDLCLIQAEVGSTKDVFDGWVSHSPPDSKATMTLPPSLQATLRHFYEALLTLESPVSFSHN